MTEPRTAPVPHNPWTFVPTEDAGMDETLDPTLPRYAYDLLLHAEPDSLRCRGCTRPVGLVSTTDEDTYGNHIEDIRWQPLTVAADSTPAGPWVACDDCADTLCPPHTPARTAPAPDDDDRDDDRATPVMEVRTPTCPGCHEGGFLTVPVEGVIAYLDGALLQDAFPTLDRADREQYKSGFHPECWRAMFGG